MGYTEKWTGGTKIQVVLELQLNRALPYVVEGNLIQGFTGSAASVTIGVELGLPDVKQITHGI